MRRKKDGNGNLGIQELEFEKSRMQILKMSNKVPERTSDNMAYDDFENIPIANDLKSSNKQAWEYELVEYRKRKRLEKYLVFTSLLSIASFGACAYLYVWIFVFGK